MNDLLKSSLPQPPKSSDSKKVAYFFAAILIIFALGQLFTFNEFLDLICDYRLIGGVFIGRLFGGLLIISEVFALPFLLGMRLNQTFRIISMVMSWVASLGWLKLSIWLNISANSINNFGFLGTKIQIVPGLWVISFSFALCILSAWASWGLWPILKDKTKTKK